MTHDGTGRTPSDSRLLELYRAMLRIRTVEVALAEHFREMRRHAQAAVGGRRASFEAYNEDFCVDIQGNLELSVGQESVAVGVCAHLTKRDYLAGTHRAHHWALAKGVSLPKILAELYGRSTGLCGGKAGDFMVHSLDVNFETSAILGELVPVAVGHALKAKFAGEPDIAVAVYGEGASNQGVIHESMNLAAVWKLPIVFVCEDNGYSLSVSREVSTSVQDLGVRGVAYGIPTTTVESNDVADIYAAFADAAEAVRSGYGPYYLVARTSRLSGAFEGDRQAYRKPGELEALRASDHLKKTEQYLRSKALLSDAQIGGWVTEARGETVRALEFAKNSPFPDSSAAYEGVFPDQPGESAAMSRPFQVTGGSLAHSDHG